MDERENKISGSGMSGYAACAGKYNAESALPKGESGPAAEMGTRIHEFIATGKGSLNEEELSIADLCVKFYAEAIDNINSGDITDSVLERRYWHGNEWSGQIDRLDFIGETTAIVTDYKTGRIAQGRAAENMQLRSYAVLVKKNFPNLKRIFVCIIQPMAGPTTIAEYDEEALWISAKEIAVVVENAYRPNAPRTPSPDACKYCRAKAVCPEAQGQASQLASVEATLVARLTNDELSKYLDRAEIVEDVISVLKAEAKQRLKDGQQIIGYTLGSGRTTRSVENAEDAFGKLKSILDAAEFAKCCKVSVPQLEKIVATAMQIKPKEAKEKLSELLGETLETKTSDSVMTRVK